MVMLRKATDQDHSWREVLPPGAGVVVGLVKAAVERGGTAGFRTITGTWPGN
jgi:hypothetical protein